MSDLRKVLCTLRIVLDLMDENDKMNGAVPTFHKYPMTSLRKLNDICLFKPDNLVVINIFTNTYDTMITWV